MKLCSKPELHHEEPERFLLRCSGFFIVNLEHVYDWVAVSTSSWEINKYVTCKRNIYIYIYIYIHIIHIYERIYYSYIHIHIIYIYILHIQYRKDIQRTVIHHA